MASIYAKHDPEPNGKTRWMARVKVGRGDWVAVSLRLEAPGSKRAAKQRALDLQSHIDAGSIGPDVAAWLAESSRARIEAKLSGAAKPAPAASGWVEAGEAYLAACAAKDHVEPVPGSARTVERTKKGRRQAILAIARWMEGAGIPFDGRSFTTGFIAYLRARVANPRLQTNSIWGADIANGLPWGEWMHSRGMCDKPDRVAIHEVVPRKVVKPVVLPAIEADVRALSALRAGAIEARDGLSTLLKLHYWSAWSLVVCVRGLGCRPSEATTLMWPSVDLDAGTVVFPDTKTRVPRKVPILYQWVHDGLAAIRAAFPGRDVVCCSIKGAAYSDDGCMRHAIRLACKASAIPVYNLKQAQKLYIAQLIATGFPPNVVAKWTGHTLTVQERHYCEDLSYLPPDNLDRYGEFGTLTTWGRKVMAHLSSNQLPSINQ